MNAPQHPPFRNRIALVLAIATLGAGGAWAVNQTLDDHALQLKTVQLSIDDRPLPREHKDNSYAHVIQRVGPSVVQIDTTAQIQPAALPDFPGWNHPFFRRFFDESARPQPRREMPRQRGIGSGVIVTPDGYILTNNHLVENADSVNVTFPDGRQLEARIVGKDPKTDVALLKVDAADLPYVTMADSDQLEVGDLVLAIGNPFGIGQTVTMGIVSATGRATLGLDYEDFIQTDAAINPGNSGGALIDTAGRLVGINTAILSRSGGNQGIGFAIPANLARNVMSGLVADGRVTRGYLGVMIQDLNPTLARAFKLERDQGALINDVVPNGPADQAGLRHGDIILEFNQKPVPDSRRLKFAVAAVAPGESVPLRIHRDGQQLNLQVTLRELPGEQPLAHHQRPSNHENARLKGVTVTDLDDSSRAEAGLPKSVLGALIARVEPDSAAREAGLQPGDVIQEIDRQPVENASDALRLTRDSKHPATLVRIWRQDGSRYVVVDETPAG
ncbi:MAG: DegQ family serine endoprotease [Verrucomicrobia bacterium]|nr:DegQ family serine endoprotease [Verrucomicrobiota bacterium]